MSFRCLAAPRPAFRAAIRFAVLVEMPESALAKRVAELEARPLFKTLLAARAVAIEPYPTARFAARRFVGRELSMQVAQHLPGSLSADAELLELISRIGAERFEECFLQEHSLCVQERAERCGISAAEAAAIGDLVDQMYVEAEFSAGPEGGPSRDPSAPVAAVEIEGGRPVLAFFNREIWKGRYRLDTDRLAQLMGGIGHEETRQLRAFVHELEEIDRRKSTLYQLLELMLQEQADYFITGALDRRKSVTQKDVARRLGVAASVINRLISNKSIASPWGREVMLKTLFPSRKQVLKDRLFDLLSHQDGRPDRQLRDEIRRRFAVQLSRRSVTAYRLELNGLHRRSPKEIACG